MWVAPSVSVAYVHNGGSPSHCFGQGDSLTGERARSPWRDAASLRAIGTESGRALNHSLAFGLFAARLQLEQTSHDARHRRTFTFRPTTSPRSSPDRLRDSRVTVRASSCPALTRPRLAVRTLSSARDLRPTGTRQSFSAHAATPAIPPMPKPSPAAANVTPAVFLTKCSTALSGFAPP